MIDDNLLGLTRCLLTHEPLRPAEPSLCERLNLAIAQGRLYNHLGRLVTRALDAGLINQRGTALYPVHDGVPQLLLDEMIPLDQPAATG